MVETTHLFSGFLTARFLIMRQEFLCICCAAGNFCMAWIAKSPAPASIAHAAFSGDLRESTVIVDIICSMMCQSSETKLSRLVKKDWLKPQFLACPNSISGKNIKTRKGGKPRGYHNI